MNDCVLLVLCHIYIAGIMSFIHWYKTVLEKPRKPYKRKFRSGKSEKLQNPKVLQSNSTASMLSLLAESYFAFNKSKLFVIWKIPNKGSE